MIEGGEVLMTLLFDIPEQQHSVYFEFHMQAALNSLLVHSTLSN